jgi:hypothetical protein
MMLLCAGLLPAQWVHVITYGQSLSVGHAGSPALSATQPYSNLMWTVCGISRTASNLGALTDPDTCQAATGEGNVEDLKPGLANTATQISGGSQVYIVSQHGVSATAYLAAPPAVCLAKACTVGAGNGTTAYGTNSYADILDSVTKAYAAAVAAGKTYRVGAIVMIHGETDAANGVSAATYEADLVQLQSQLEADVKAIDGQTAGVPLLTGQMSNWTSYLDTATMPGVPAGQMQAALDYPSKIMLLGPEYIYPTYTDGVHLINTSYRELGGLAGKIVDIVARQARPWVALMPTAITISGSTITANFYVPSGSLTCDTTTFSEPVTGLCGFEFHQTGASPPTISSVSVSGSTATITLSGATAGTPYLAYARTGTAGANAGPATGPRGNLRDTDPTLDYAGDHLYDWCPSFNFALPYAWAPPAGPHTATGVKLVRH